MFLRWKKWFYFVLCVGFIDCFSASYNMLVIDTAYKDGSIYNRFFDIAKQANFAITYKGLADIIDTDIALEKYDIVLFMLDDGLVAQLHTSPISKRVLDLIKKQSQVLGTVSMFLLPSFSSFAYRNVTTGHPLTVYNVLFSYFGLSINRFGVVEIQVSKNQQNFDFSGISYKGKLEQLLKNPFEWIGGYATSLQPAPEKKSFMVHIQGDTLGFFLPSNRGQHGFFVGNLAVASYASISEHCRLAPLDDEVQKKLDEDVFKGFLKISQYLDRLKGGNASVADRQFMHDQLEGGRGSLVRDRENKVQPVLAWMDIEVFQDATQHIEQARLIEVLLRGNFDILWLSIAPNQYFSVRAKFFNRRELLGKAIEAFSKQLQEAYSKKQKQLPQIFISFEIANNFVDQNKYPQKSMIDLFGTSFKDVPEPLDRNWWRDEVIISAERFMPFWRTHAQGLAIAGFFLDLEMYLRNETQIGEFVSTSLATVVHDKILTTEAALRGEAHAVARELLALKKGKRYYNFLVEHAEELGRWLKKSLQKIDPQLRVACYAATVSMDWFYQGFYRGLSSIKEPLLLCSFNSRFDWFKHICIGKNIYIEYAAALMLSQVKTTENFSLFKKLLGRNDGVWLNKVSRMAYEYQSHEWHVLEQTPLSFSDRLGFMDVVAKR